MRWVHASAAAYLVGVFLTFGYVYNHYDCGEMARSWCQYDRGPTSVAKGIAWPVYWAGVVALDVTK